MYVFAHGVKALIFLSICSAVSFSKFKMTLRLFDIAAASFCKQITLRRYSFRPRSRC